VISFFFFFPFPGSLGDSNHHGLSTEFSASRTAVRTFSSFPFFLFPPFFFLFCGACGQLVRRRDDAPSLFPPFSFPFFFLSRKLSSKTTGTCCSRHAAQQVFRFFFPFLPPFFVDKKTSADSWMDSAAWLFESRARRGAGETHPLFPPSSLFFFQGLNPMPHSVCLVEKK